MKTVFITGASRGIGKAIALRFAKEKYHVIINCVKSADKLEEVRKQIEDLGSSCTALVGDVGNPDEVRLMFKEINKITPHLDVLVNNAGIAMYGLLQDCTDEDWMKMMQTNLSSAFYCCREALPGMIDAKKGSIINISSMWGTAGASYETIYSAAKSGLNGLTKALAKETAPSGIAVNAAAFGVIDTEMNGHLSKEERAALEEEIPAGRYASAEEAAELVWHISQCPSYMTGQIIGMDGGYL